MTDVNPNEIRTVSPTGGEKGVKPERFDLIPVEALQSIARLYGQGAKKYDAHNWRKGYEWSKSYAAMQRHAALFWSGEDVDPETGEPHMAAVAFHAMTLIVFMQEQPEFDDRYIAERENSPEEEYRLEEARRSEEALAALRTRLTEQHPDIPQVTHTEWSNEELTRNSVALKNHVDQEVYVPLRPSNLQASQE